MRASYGRSDAGYRQTRRKPGRRRKGSGAAFSSRERQRLIQLVVCIFLFTAVLIGKGVFPQQMEVWKENTRTVLRRDTDFKAAFIGLGRAISEGEPILETLQELWIETIGNQTPPAGTKIPPVQAPVYEQVLAFLGKKPGAQTLASRLGYDERTAVEPMGQNDEAENDTAGWAAHEDATQPAVLEPQPQPAQKEEDLPDNCTMEKIALALSKTTTPVLGVITSDYGYRMHPIDEEIKFHYGTDIAAEIGTPVFAFADGVVDFIGESPAYGQYIQLRHDGGVTTFYAHCSKLCAKKGQKVSIGDTIAKVGQSGNTTGPHLHFEIRVNGIFLNPINYIDTL